MLFFSTLRCLARLRPPEEAVPKLSNCLTSERVIPNYMPDLVYWGHELSYI